MSLRPLFTAFPRRGAELRRRELADALGDATLAVLERAGVVARAGIVHTYPCEDHGPGCPRIVRLVPGTRRALAVCGRDEPFCSTLRLTEDDVAASRLDVDALAAKLAALAGVPAAERRTSAAPLLSLGVLRTWQPATELLFAPWVSDPAFVGALAERATAERPAVVLVPTLDDVPAWAAAQNDHGTRLAVLALEDVLTIVDDELVLTLPQRRAALALVPPAPATLTPLHAGLPRPASWPELRLHLVDGHTVSVRVGKTAMRRTYADLGMASAKNREPTKQWQLLVALCEGGGTFRWKDLGTFEVAKRRVARLRDDLQAAFGLEDDPFEPFDRRHGWKARFVARDLADDD